MARTPAHFTFCHALLTLVYEVFPQWHAQMRAVAGRKVVQVSVPLNSMHASTVRAVFDLPLPVLHFVADPHTLVRLCINFTKLNFQLFQ